MILGSLLWVALLELGVLADNLQRALPTSAILQHCVSVIWLPVLPAPALSSASSSLVLVGSPLLLLPNTDDRKSLF